jgi:hypothetical protein
MTGLFPLVMPGHDGENLFAPAILSSLRALQTTVGRSTPQSAPGLVSGAKCANSKTRGRHRAVAEKTDKKAERQDDPGDIPQNDLMGQSILLEGRRPIVWGT